MLWDRKYSHYLGREGAMKTSQGYDVSEEMIQAGVEIFDVMHDKVSVHYLVLQIYLAMRKHLT